MRIKGFLARLVSPDALFPAVIGLSGFLLITLILVSTRSAEPLFGDSSGLWVTALAFLAIVAFLGYLYAHFLITRLALVRGGTLHLLVAAIAVVSLLVMPRDVSTLRLPGLSESGNVLVVLMLSAGPAAFLLASTTPLLSAWYGMFRQDPWWLYAVTTGGGFIALVTYAFVIAPAMGIAARWSIVLAGIVVVSVVLALIVVAIRRGQEPPEALDDQAPDPPKASRPVIPPGPPRRRQATWLVSTLITAGLLSATTEFVTTEGIAPVLAIGPLAVYLLSFVIAFSTRGRRLVRASRLVAPVAVLLLVVPWAVPVRWPAPATLAVLLVAFLVLAVAVHGRLAGDRPERIQLTRFYLVMATGTLLGASFVAFVAPVVLGTTYEYPVFAAGGLFALALLPDRKSTTDRKPSRTRRLVPYLLAVAVAAVVGALIVGGPEGPSVAQSRNFFGVVQVDREGASHREYLGSGPRGIQFLDIRGTEPTTAYIRTGPLGQVMQEVAASTDHPVIAVVGLGVGTVGAYARDVDRFTFYEVDPTIVGNAVDRRLFHYLFDMPLAPRIVVDGVRHALPVQAATTYDLLVVDASTATSSGVPVHLLTVEALSAFASSLRPDGLILFNVTNAWTDLRPSVISTARSLGLAASTIDFEPDATEVKTLAATPSSWVIVGSDARVQAFATLGWTDGGQIQGPILTDDFPNVPWTLRP